MKKIAFLMVAMLMITTFASALEIKSVDTPTKKIRFTTEDGQYVSSVIIYSNIGKEAVDILEKHFSQEREVPVTGLIWENVSEGPEIMLHVYDMDNNFVADIRVSVDYFSHEGKFFYRVERLKQAAEEALEMEINISGIREKGDNSRQKIMYTDSGFMILEL